MVKAQEELYNWQMSKEISNFQIEQAIKNLNDDDIMKNFVGVFPAIHMNKLY